MTAPSPFRLKPRGRPEASAAAVLALLLRGAVASTAPGPDAAGAAPPDVYRFSASQRFAARAPNPSMIVPFLAQIEEVAGRLERAVGAPLPSARGMPMVFVLGRDASAGVAPVRRVLLTGANGMGQRIEIPNLDAAEPAEVLGATVSMMLARYIAMRQSPAARADAPARAPDWFAYGLAGSLYAAPRAAYQRDALDLWLRGEDLPLPALLSAVAGGGAWRNLIPHWTAWVAWLQTHAGFRAWVSRWLDEWSRGRTLAATDIAGLMDASWTEDDLLQNWDLAVAAVRRTDAPHLLTELALVERLRTALARPRALFPLALPEDAPDPVTPAVLLARRPEPWTPAAARLMRTDVAGIPAGGSPRVSALVERYLHVLRILGTPTPAGPIGALRRGLEGWRLRRALAEAGRRLDDAEALARAAEALPRNDEPSPAPALDEDRLLEIEAQRAIFFDAFRSHPSR